MGTGWDTPKGGNTHTTSLLRRRTTFVRFVRSTPKLPPAHTHTYTHTNTGPDRSVNAVVEAVTVVNE